MEIENAVGVGTTTGKHATAKVTVDKHNGGITNITIMNPGSAFGIGNTMFMLLVLQQVLLILVEVIVLRRLQLLRLIIILVMLLELSGVSCDKYNQYNDLYRISDIHVGAARSFSIIVTLL